MPLPEPAPRWSPPPSPDRRTGPGGRRRPARAAGRARWLTAAALVLVVLGVAALIGGGDAPGPAPVTDIATEDAVVGVLQVYVAEADLAAVVTPITAFGLPGPAVRATALDELIQSTRTVLEQARQTDPAAGTPGATYTAHPDHDTLLGVAVDLAAETRELAFLTEVHATLFTGSGTVTPDEVARGLQAVLTGAGGQPLRDWAQMLAQAAGGDRTVLVGPAEAARGAAGAHWEQQAARLAPAALPPLVHFLNGIDPGVIAALDGHPVAGPALRRLRG
ncbi:hypothetical protein BH23ACT9_BH23ACT9_23670 [soil metagenome]